MDEPSGARIGSRAYRYYVLGVLTLVYTLNFTDRGLIVLLLEPIKADLQLSDTQLGFLTGIAFALFYATVGIPIARWADRGNRVTIMSLAIGTWGLTVLMCLFVRNFVQLVFARVAAAVGESGCTPPTYSLLGDYFPGPAERTRAMAVYWLANPLSALISFVIGGWVAELYGWRMTFFLMGLPGLLVAILVRLTVHEPRACAPIATSGERAGRMVDVLRVLWRSRSARHLSIGVILLFTMGLGMSPWYAAFMARSHGMGTAEIGLWLGTLFGLAGIVGIALGGYVPTRWFARDGRGQMRLSAVMIGSLVPSCVLFLVLPQKHYALLALIPVAVMFNFFLGPAFALMQRLVPSDMRATSLAVVMLLANLIGMGIGPQIVGILSDALRSWVGAESLRYAMLMMSFVALWSAWHFWIAGRTMDRDLASVQAASSDLQASPLWMESEARG
jgi:predicted MFS family arabinose efflux permease